MTLSYALLCLICMATIFGCGPKVSSPATLDISEVQPEERYNTEGVLELGSPSLTAGIPGSGILKLEEIERWLADPHNHEPLQLALPLHLQSTEKGEHVHAGYKLTRAKIELGRQLFFDPRFSASQAMACADCHHPKKAYTNFIGQYGELRDPLPNFNRILGKVHFWDGRVDSLEQQVRVPIESPHEMRTTPEEVLRKIRASSGYRRQFETIFGEITFDAFSRAIASFERVLVTEPSAWDRSQAGESDALTAAAQRGAELFASERTRCNTCHSGPNFTDESFHHVGTGGGRKPDAGRYNVTNLPQDRGAFRTPTLRNVAKTGPYFHDARFQSLAEVVRWFNAGGHEDSEDNSANNELKPLNLTAREQADLIVFLEGLSSDLPPVATGRLPE